MKNNLLLRRYIELFLQEEFERSPRVPQQLVPDEEDKDDDDKKDKSSSVDEFSNCGAVAGFVGGNNVKRTVK